MRFIEAARSPLPRLRTFYSHFRSPAMVTDAVVKSMMAVPRNMVDWRLSLSGDLFIAIGGA
jgi:hypothetical protein